MANTANEALAELANGALDDLDVPRHLTSREIRGILERAVQAAYTLGVNDTARLVREHAGWTGL